MNVNKLIQKVYLLQESLTGFDSNNGKSVLSVRWQELFLIRVLADPLRNL
ncbi:hypothetical protein Sps_05143 [Shewanella psychrophila]|uniref:Uncharacterized protein n=1 Tax=Shewanella psychrophila TaxID=225848 RepID=A0A1S6HXK8_9GAMM|nr:hypothetical protein Sps_05143 [Shewanella psychrophila]